MSKAVVVTEAPTRAPDSIIDTVVPGPVSVLIEWIILLISTIAGYFKNK